MSTPVAPVAVATPRPNAIGLAATRPWYSALQRALERDQAFTAPESTEQPAESLEDAESRIFDSAPMRKIPVPERNLAKLAFWLGIGAAEPLGRLRQVGPETCKRICALINAVGANNPEYISEPGMWNVPGAARRTGGRMAEALVLQDASLDMDLLKPGLRAGLLASCSDGVVGLQNTKGWVSLGRMAASDGLLSAAGWASSNTEFAAEMARALNDQKWMNLFLRSCLVQSPAGDSARKVLDVMVEAHGEQVRTKAGMAKLTTGSQAMKPMVERLLFSWRRVLDSPDGATGRVDHVIRQACDLVGMDYLSTIRRMSTEVIFHGAGAAGKLPVPDSSVIAMFDAFAAAGIGADAKMFTPTNKLTRRSDAMAPLYSQAVIDQYRAQSLAHMMTRAAQDPDSPSATMLSKVQDGAAGKDSPAPVRARPKA